MHNQHETTNQNMVKVIGLSVLMLMLLLAFFFNKGDNDSNPFGLPIDKVEKTDSTSVPK